MGRPGSIASVVVAQTPVTPAPSATAPTVPTCQPPSGTLTPLGLSEMDVRTLGAMSPQKRLTWYSNQLNKYQSEVRGSAACNMIPQQLLATVILNELADINWMDTWQQSLSTSGSLGIAQIQVSTAKSHGLVTQPGDTLPLSDAAVAKRLTIPQYAIEAAAREIHELIDRMTKNLSNPWQQHFAFTLTAFSQLASPNDIYSYIAGATQRDKELNLSELVVAAYNSPGIIDAKQQASVTPSAPTFIYRNGTIHGGNSRFIARELYDNNLFH